LVFFSVWLPAPLLALMRQAESLIAAPP
jgi:hypothetical protein